MIHIMNSSKAPDIRKSNTHPENMDVTIEMNDLDVSNLNQLEASLAVPAPNYLDVSDLNQAPSSVPPRDATSPVCNRLTFKRLCIAFSMFITVLDVSAALYFGYRGQSSCK